MKKFIVVFLLLGSLLSAQEIVVIDGYELMIPENYDELRENYITMTGLYLQSETDLDTALDNNEKLQEEYDTLLDVNSDQEDTITALTADIEDTLTPTIEDLEEQVTELTRQLKKFMKSDTIALAPMISYKHNTPTSAGYRPTIGIGAQFLILEKLNVGAYYNFDNTFTINLGYTVFKY